MLWAKIQSMTNNAYIVFKWVKIVWKSEVSGNLKQYEASGSTSIDYFIRSVKRKGEVEKLVHAYSWDIGRPHIPVSSIFLR